MLMMERPATSFLRRFERTSEPLPVALSLSQLQRAISHEGGLERLRCFLHRLQSGTERLTVAAVGGSITAMSSSVVAPSLAATYHVKVHRWLERNGGPSPRANLSHSTTAIPSILHKDYLPGYTQWAHSLHCRPATGYSEAKRAWRKAGSATQPNRSQCGPPGRLHEPCGAYPIWTVEDSGG